MTCCGKDMHNVMKEMALCNMKAQLKHLRGSICKVYKIKTILKVFKHRPKGKLTNKRGKCWSANLKDSQEISKSWFGL